MSITARNSGYNIVDMRSGRGIVFDNINSLDAKTKKRQTGSGGRMTKKHQSMSRVKVPKIELIYANFETSGRQDY